MPTITASSIIKETTAEIRDVLSVKEFVSYSNSIDKWIKVAEGFEKQWNFPNCLGLSSDTELALLTSELVVQLNVSTNSLHGWFLIN